MKIKKIKSSETNIKGWKFEIIVGKKIITLNKISIIKKKIITYNK